MTKLDTAFASRPLCRRSAVHALGVVGASIVAAIGVALVVPHSNAVVHATSGGSVDPDGDGLPSAFEVAVGTDPYQVDSDGDGFSDAEEIARHSSPSKTWETPSHQAANIGMGAALGGHFIHVLTCLYFRDGTISDKHLEFGMMYAGKLIPGTPLANGATQTVTIVPAAVPGELVMVYDTPISPTVVRKTGSLAIYAIVTGPNGLKIADAINLANINSLIGQRLLTTTQSGGSPGTTIQVTSGGGTTVFRPLGGSVTPPTWTPGEICSQTTQVVGYSGPTLTQEVIAADCETGWDAYCDMTCSASVGSTIQLLDPAVLAGG